MAIMAMDTKVKYASILFAFTLTPFSSIAGKWSFESAVNIEETYSDNLTLSTSDEKSGVVSQSIIDLTTTYEAQNASMSLTTNSTYAWYSHDHSLDNDYHNVQANGQILLWPNGITLNINGSVQNRSRNGANNALADIVSGDLTQTENYGAGLSYDINNSRYSLQTAVNYSSSQAEDGIGERDNSSFSLSSSNGSAAKNIFWDTSAQFSERKNNSQDSKQTSVEAKIGLLTSYKFIPFIRYYNEDNSGNISSNSSLFETESYGLGFRWQPIPRLYIDLSYNEPFEDAEATSNSQQDAYIDVSLNWQPSSRTQLQASHSQRFYGDSYGLNLTHQNRRLTNTVSYSEQVQSFTRENYLNVSTDFLCQNPDATTLDDCFVQSGDDFNPGDSFILTIDNLVLIEDDSYWLNKNLNWSSQLTLPRTTFSLNLTHSNRENLNTGSKNDSKSISTSIDRKLSPRSNMTFSASYRDGGYGQISNNTLSSTSGQNDKYRRYGINLDRKLNQALNITLNLDHINRESNNERFNYTENRIALRLTKDF